MASLDEIASHLKVDAQQKPQSKEANKIVVGQKRRPWLAGSAEEVQPDSKGVYRPDSQKGFIDPVDQPFLSTPLINPIDQPPKDKGFIKGVYKPLSISLENLRGNPLKLAQFLYDLMTSGTDKITRKITQTEIIQAIGISKDSAKTAIRFLLKNKLIERVNFKIGKKGWSQYAMQDALFNEIEIDIARGRLQPFSINNNSSSNQKGFISSSSIIINTNKRTTTTSELVDNLNINWDTVDTAPLATIGFTKTHLSQIAQQGRLPPEIVQDSIYAFAFDLERNNKGASIKGDALNYFMGILRNGKPYAPSGNYESPQDREMRLYLERKREIDQKRSAMEKELFDMTFTEWENTLSEDQINNLLPGNIRNSRLRSDKTVFLRKYFLESIWPQKRKDLNFN